MIAGTLLGSIFSGTNLASYATGSYTPTANTLLLAFVHNQLSGTPQTPTFSGNGLTWTQVTTYLFDNSGAQDRLTVFASWTGAAPTNGAGTADFAGNVQDGCCVIVDQFSGVNFDGNVLNSIVQNKTGSLNTSGNSENISLTNAIGAGNATTGCFGHEANETLTNGSGYTTLGNGSHAGPNGSLMAEYRADGQTTVDASWVTAAIKGGVALELRATVSSSTGFFDPGTGMGADWLEERARPEDKSPRKNPTRREVQHKQQEEIIIL